MHSASQKNKTLHENYLSLISDLTNLQEERDRISLKNITFSWFTPVMTIASESNSYYIFYLTQILRFSSTISMIQPIFSQLLKKECSNYDINLINSFFQDTKQYKQDFTKEIKEEFQENILIVIIVSSVLSAILLLLFCTSLYFFKRIHGQIKVIYSCLLSMYSHELIERKNELVELQDLIKGFKENIYYGDYMDSINAQKDIRTRQISQKLSRRYSQGNFCIRLLKVVFLLFGSYLVQTLVSIALVVTYSNSATTLLSLRNKQTIFDDVFSDQLFIYNNIISYAVFGESFTLDYPTTQLSNRWPSLIEQMQRGQDKISKLLKEEDSAYRGVEDLIRNIQGKSLCKEFKRLKDRKELCQYLDTKIPEKGVIQALYRNYQILSDVLNTLEQGTNTVSGVISQDNFLEWEYTFDVVYTEAFRNLQEMNFQILKEYQDRQVQIIKILNIFLVSLSSLALIVGAVVFFMLRRLVKSAVDCFEMLTIHTIFENTDIKVTFMRIFGINVNNFTAQNQNNQKI